MTCPNAQLGTRWGLRRGALLAGFVAAEIDKHFKDDRYRRLDRRQARRLAQEQAEFLWHEEHRHHHRF